MEKMRGRGEMAVLRSCGGGSGGGGGGGGNRKAARW